MQLSTTVKVTVYVLDQNDNPPVFVQEVGLYYIYEQQPTENVFQVSCKGYS